MHLKEYLWKECITQDDFAELVGVTPASMSRWVNSTRERPMFPSRKMIRKIMDLTGGQVSVDDWDREDPFQENQE